LIGGATRAGECRYRRLQVGLHVVGFRAVFEQEFDRVEITTAGGDDQRRGTACQRTTARFGRAEKEFHVRIGAVL
jgi:hypothetical protein